MTFSPYPSGPTRNGAPRWSRGLAAGVVALAAALAAAGCGSDESPAADAGAKPGKRVAAAEKRVRLRVDGQVRSALVHVPAHRAGQRLPIVLAFHGRWSSAAEVRAQTRLDRAADRRGFVVAFPEGVDRQWSDARRPLEDGLDPDADIRFVEQLVRRLARRGWIDREHVTAVGHSNGGGFVLRLAVERPKLLERAAATAAQLPIESPEPRRGAPDLLLVYGTADPFRPYEGLPNPPEGSGATPTRSIRATAEAFAVVAGASATPDRNLPDRKPDDGTILTLTEWKAGRRAPARLITVVGGGHTWPGSKGAQPPGVGVVSDELDATAVVSDFLLRGRFPLGR